MCVNCSTASMTCSFTSPAHTIRILQRDGPKTFTPPDTMSRISTPTSSSSIHPALVQIEPYVNTTHLELFYLIIGDGESIFGDDHHKGARPHVLKHASHTHSFWMSVLLSQHYISALVGHHNSPSILRKPLVYSLKQCACSMILYEIWTTRISFLSSFSQVFWALQPSSRHSST